MRLDPRRVQIADRVRLEHMRRAARDALRYMDSRSRADLDADSMLARAVLHAVQEIGEAASQVTQPTRERAPTVPWTQIVGMRHRLVHVYWGIDLDLVFEVVVRHLAPLVQAIDVATKDWPLDPPPANPPTPTP